MCLSNFLNFSDAAMADIYMQQRNIEVVSYFFVPEHNASMHSGSAHHAA